MSTNADDKSIFSEHEYSRKVVLDKEQFYELDFSLAAPYPVSAVVTGVPYDIIQNYSRSFLEAFYEETGYSRSEYRTYLAPQPFYELGKFKSDNTDNARKVAVFADDRLRLEFLKYIATLKIVDYQGSSWGLAVIKHNIIDAFAVLNSTTVAKRTIQYVCPYKEGRIVMPVPKIGSRIYAGAVLETQYNKDLEVDLWQRKNPQTSTTQS